MRQNNGQIQSHRQNLILNMKPDLMIEVCTLKVILSARADAVVRVVLHLPGGSTLVGCFEIIIVITRRNCLKTK